MHLVEQWLEEVLVLQDRDSRKTNFVKYKVACIVAANKHQ